MKGLTKFTALFLAVLMSVSVLSLTAPVSAASAYEYNVYMNAMVVSAENSTILLDDSNTGMIAQAKAMSADAIVLNAGKYSRVSVSINDAMLAQLSSGNLPVRIILDKGKAHVNAATLKELSDKVSDKLEIEFAIGEKTVISVKADGATIELDTPITIVAESVNEGANTANVGEKPYGAAYVDGAKWGFLAASDTEIELKKTQTPVFNDIVSNHWAKENIAFVTTTGIGTPISPAFSTMLMVSFAIYPMMTASRTKFVPITRSSRQAIKTIRRVTPFLQRPFQPALDSKAPLSVFVLLWKIPATISPVT